jgi:hypothetical protein
VRPARHSERCLPFWQLVAGWVIATSIVAVLAARWIGWAVGPNPVPQAWILAGPALALLAVSVIALLRSLLAQLRGERRLAKWVRLRTLPVPQRLATAVVDAGIPRFRFVSEQRPSAFTFGGARPVVVVTSGLLNEVDPVALRAILLHEAAHARARDPSRLLLARVISAALLAVPPAARVAERCHQWIELAADRAALAQVGRLPLATALLALLQRPEWLGPGTGASVVEARDLLPVRLLQLADYPTLPDLPPANRRRESVSTAALVAMIAALAALPCTLFAALIDRITSGGSALW